MKKRLILVLVLGLIFFLLGEGIAASKEQAKSKTKATQVNPVSVMTKAMTDRLSSSLHVKNVVGDPVKVGQVTIIPIIMIDVGFGGGGGGPGGGQAMAGQGFYTSGEARPIGFVIITKKETKFISVGKIPRK